MSYSLIESEWYALHEIPIAVITLSVNVWCFFQHTACCEHRGILQVSLGVLLIRGSRHMFRVHLGHRLRCTPMAVHRRTCCGALTVVCILQWLGDHLITWPTDALLPLWLISAIREGTSVILAECRYVSVPWLFRLSGVPVLRQTLDDLRYFSCLYPNFANMSKQWLVKSA